MGWLARGRVIQEPFRLSGDKKGLFGIKVILDDDLAGGGESATTARDTVCK